ncbi:MAG: penicillin-binding transpeptidase domain-containing protein [Clostridia bacterium]|nr:penicillin-binding transpeptidase domain-containing protein [Clostridia bacterium]
MKKIIIIISVIVCLSILAVGGFLIYSSKTTKPENILNEYISKINEAKYNEMYEMISDRSKGQITEEDFVKRNKNIYEGIDMSNLKIDIKNIEKESSKKYAITYITSMNVSGQNISFENRSNIIKEDNKLKIDWSSNMIFPNLNVTDKVKVSTSKAIRGKILDRNGKELATNGKISSVGIVPGKLGENKTESINKIAELLNLSSETIENKLKASWVKDESFVPIKNVSMDENDLKEKLLQIKGVMISSTNGRIYPLGEAAAHLTGYIQSITKEELEKNPEYSSTSLIGKTGLEKRYEKELKGKDGIEIYIADSEGNKKDTIIKKEKVDGENIKITIDSIIQNNLYKELKNDEGLFVVMNHKTGEIIALVSTPSYNVNKMALGVSSEEWKELQENEKTPLIARYTQKYCPGSTFKPITGAIGLSTNSLKNTDTFSYSGKSWQKDKSWGDYNITTLTAYSGEKNLKNALIHSDNIYFAQATLQSGKDNFIDGLKKLKFGEDIDFELNLSKSQFSNSDTIKSETLLADSGYGQGQILVNPIHMASIYSSFANNGNMVKPYLKYKENKETEYLAKEVFTKDAVQEIKNDLIQVVENPEGTAKDMKINGVTIAGKTGTAELKVSKDSEGDTIGWFDCFTVDDSNMPYVIVGMVEKANKNGGSHYVIPMIRRLFIK